MVSQQSSMASIDAAEPVPSGVGAALGDNPTARDDHASRPIRVALQLVARDLPNLDTRGKSDPFVVVYRKSDSSTSNTEQWDKFGQTETVYNNLNPKWSKTFTVEYRFGTTTVLRFAVYDRDCKDEDLSKHDYIGEVRCTVAQVVLADNQRLLLQINNKNAKPGTRTGTITIRAEEQQGDLGDSVTLQFAVTGLRRGRKPFYVLSNKNRNDDEYSPVIYSEVHKAYAGANHVTTFKPITTSLARLANGDMDRELEVQFMDYDRLGSHYRGGSVRFTLRTAKAAVANSSPARFPLRKKKTNGQVVEAGQLILNKCEISVSFSFVDYIRSGVEINTMIAIDMSNTNGNPADPRSLHYNLGENDYAIALREVGSVLAAYDTTQQFPAFGFGAAQPPLYHETQHCFPLNVHNGQAMCNGVKGVIDAYMRALHKVGPFEPCRYGPVLKHVIELTRAANAKPGAVSYTILLLFTDGDFADFADVANLICDGAELPLSIVIVGVGNSRFLKLERLDGDNERLCSTEGIPCARDIVQFVQFHKHRYNPTQLAREVLDEIPEQLVSYMRSKGLKPSDIKPLRRPRLSTPATENVPYLPESVLHSITSSSSSQIAAEVGHMPDIAPQPPGRVQPAVSVQHSAQFAPAGTAGQPAVSVQRPPQFTPSATAGLPTVSMEHPPQYAPAGTAGLPTVSMEHPPQYAPAGTTGLPTGSMEHPPQYAPAGTAGLPTGSMEHPPQYAPAGTAGQPTLSVQHPPQFTAAGTVSMPAGPFGTPSFPQSPMSLHGGVPAHTIEQRLSSMQCSGTESIPPSSVLSRPARPTQGAQSGMSSQAAVHPHSVHPQNSNNPQSSLPGHSTQSGMSSQVAVHQQSLQHQSSYNPQSVPAQGTQLGVSAQAAVNQQGLHHLNPLDPQSDTQASSKFGLMQYSPSQYPPSQYPPSQYLGGYSDPTYHQQSSLPQQVHQSPYQQQPHQQPPHYRPPQSHHPQQQSRPQQYPPQMYPYPYTNTQYGSAYPQAPQTDFTATYTPYSVHPGQNYQYPPGTMPLPPAELPFQSQYGRPNYPSQ